MAFSYEKVYTHAHTQAKYTTTHWDKGNNRGDSEEKGEVYIPSRLNGGRTYISQFPVVFVCNATSMQYPHDSLNGVPAVYSVELIHSPSHSSPCLFL